MMRGFLVIILVFSIFSVLAQSNNFFGGFSPELSVSYKINERYKFSSKIESFHFFYDPGGSGTSSWRHRYDGTDLQFFLQRKIGVFQGIAIGYQYGIVSEGHGSHRSIIQYTFVNRMAGAVMGHRVRSDQTFYHDNSPKFRLRYRISLEVPLQGQELDPKELFVYFSEEPIYSWQNSEGDFQNNGAAFIGYYTGGKDKIQLGLDYRMALSDEPISQVLWLKITYYVNL